MIARDMSQAIADLFAETGATGYGAALDRLTRIGADFDMSCVFGFSAQKSPVVIHDGYSETVNRRALQSYLRGAYLLDPFYAASIGDIPEGLWRMRDLAPDAYYDTEFAWSQEVHPCISDQAGTLVEEIGYVVPLTGRFTATYSLMRNRGGACFNEAEAERLRQLLPVIAASLRLHWDISCGSDQTGNPALDSEEVFSAAFHVLTPAQQAVTKLILRGHSNISIASNLDITEGTVKQHRYNIYKRLGISSQSELFQRFIDYLGG